ncbi:MAG: hypothetical protein H7321_04530 [Bacteroidia bacterium]|nr:hypothetical protein [Bacteroidia bacterium]
MSIPLIGFYHNSEQYVFSGSANVPLHVGDHVPVVYHPSDPDNALVYNFDGVWLGPLIYSIFPLLILTAVLFSFFKRDDLLAVRFKPFSIKKLKLAEPDE